MNKNVKELQLALEILSHISVSGNAVDLMAAAKQKIRNVITEITEEADKN